MTGTEEVTKQPPWLRGIIDTLVGARLIKSSQIPHRNRLAVILLDSAFETACRAFLRYRENIKLEDAHRDRENLVKTVKARMKDVDAAVWKSLDFFYGEIRCDLYHESSGKTVTDESLFDYQETVEFVLDRAFGINSAELATGGLRTLPISEGADPNTGKGLPALSAARGRTEKVIIAVSAVRPKTYQEVNEFLRREGDSLRLSSNDFTSLVGRNSGSKRYFFRNKQEGRWELSSIGRFKLSQLTEEQKE